MDTLPILIYPDERLHLSCEDVTEFGVDLEQFGVMLLRTMKTQRGIGLAAPQVNIHTNIIAVWIEKEMPMIFVNPKIVESSETLFKYGEGCLSVPDYFEDRERPKKIDLHYQDTNGNHHEDVFEDLYAFCIQHEMDHLKGKVFIDNLSQLKKDRIKTKIRKLRK